MKIAFTVNGPGEYAGWLRPLLTALYTRQPDLDASVFFVPDDFATGRESEVARRDFPRLRAFSPGEYVRFALGRSVADVPTSVDRVQYLGGDLMHAARVHDRLGGIATSFKFSRPRYSERFARVFGVDEKNREDLLRWKTPADRIEIVGNLAIDGALREAAIADGVIDAFARDGIVIMPGTRRQEVANMVPFFLAVALRLRAIDPKISIVFGISPFTSDDELRKGLETGGLRTVYGVRGRVVERDGISYITSADGAHEFPIARRALRAASRARLALTIPGTKTIELAAIGIPAIVATPFNAPEAVVITGPLQYVERIPVVGTSIKRTLALEFSKRFDFYAQPNMDAKRDLMLELSGTLTPGYVARRAYERYGDGQWLEAAARDLRALYAQHAGAAERMAAALAA